MDVVGTCVEAAKVDMCQKVEIVVSSANAQVMINAKRDGMVMAVAIAVTLVTGLARRTVAPNCGHS